MIADYHPNQQDDIRRKHILRGLVQPQKHNFPQRLIDDRVHKFHPSLFKDYSWLEYSIKKDVVFCLYCYLSPGKANDAFISEGFSSWNKKYRLDDHVGSYTSAHFHAMKNYEDFKRHDKSIRASLEKQLELAKKDYKLCLITSIECSRFLLHQGLPFRGHDESEELENRGNFLELVKFAVTPNDTIVEVVLDNGLGNQIMTTPPIQKDIVNSTARETLNAIIKELENDLFGILVDESGDVSHKEQMALVLRFVDKLGVVKERYVSIVHVKNTCALRLKEAIEIFFFKTWVEFV